MSKKKPSRSKTLTAYRDVMKVAAKPAAEREALPIGKDGKKVVPRKFHLTPAEVREMREAFEASGRGAIPNPYRGVYGAIVESLMTLGVNEAHDFAAVKAEVKSILSDPKTRRGEGAEATTAWERFADKDARNAETGKDVDGRLLQNAQVLQRLSGMTPYGLKLLQVGKEILKTKGLVIDILDLDGKPGLRLNTDAAEPTNERRRPGKTVRGGKGKVPKAGEGKCKNGGGVAKGDRGRGKAKNPKRDKVAERPAKASEAATAAGGADAPNRVGEGGASDAA